MKRNLKSRLTVQLDEAALALVKRIQRRIERREHAIVPAGLLIGCALEMFEVMLISFHREEDRRARP
jgi:hypothetical protein